MEVASFVSVEVEQMIDPLSCHRRRRHHSGFKQATFTGESWGDLRADLLDVEEVHWLVLTRKKSVR